MPFTSLAISSPLTIVNSTHAAQKGMFWDLSQPAGPSPLNVVNSTHEAQKGMFWDLSESELKMSHEVSSVGSTANHASQRPLNILA